MKEGTCRSKEIVAALLVPVHQAAIYGGTLQGMCAGGRAWPGRSHSPDPLPPFFFGVKRPQAVCVGGGGGAIL